MNTYFLVLRYEDGTVEVVTSTGNTEGEAFDKVLDNQEEQSAAAMSYKAIGKEMVAHKEARIKYWQERIKLLAPMVRAVGTPRMHLIPTDKVGIF